MFELFALPWKSCSRRPRLRKRLFTRFHIEMLEHRLALHGPWEFGSSQSHDAPDPVWFEKVSPVHTVSLDSVTTLQRELSGPSLADLQSSYEWIVRLQPELLNTVSSVSDANQLFLEQHDPRIQVIRGLGLPGQLLVRSHAMPKSEALQTLHDSPLVAYLEPISAVRGQENIPADPQFDRQIGMEMIEATKAWMVTTGSPTVVVGILDSGIDTTHPDLYQNIWLNQGELPTHWLNDGKPAEAESFTLNPNEPPEMLFDFDPDGRITFFDLNTTFEDLGLEHLAPAGTKNVHVALGLVTDHNENGFIDGQDLLADSIWADGVDTDQNGFLDDLIGWDFKNGDNDPTDDNRHGTHVAGIVGAKAGSQDDEENDGDEIGVAGVNWKTSLMALKFLDERNRGSNAEAIEAINYATMMRSRGVPVRVTNNSWGDVGDFDQGLYDAIAASADQDILFVAAAGNGNVFGDGIDIDRTEYFPAGFDLDNILSVAALGLDDELARFSNFGNQLVDIAAPGVAIESTRLDGTLDALTESRNGTSMAAPHVSGVAALVFSEQPQATALEVRNAILEGATVAPELNGLVSSSAQLNADGALHATTFGPTISLEPVAPMIQSGSGPIELKIRFADREGVQLDSLDDSDLLITRRGFSRVQWMATLERPEMIEDATDFIATYRLAPPSDHPFGIAPERWHAIDNGTYDVTLRPTEVQDANGVYAAAKILGTFSVDIDHSPSNNAPDGEPVYEPDYVVFVDSFEDESDANLLDGDSRSASGMTSLRAAIQQANHTPGDTAIVLPDGFYSLTLDGDDNLAAFGDLDVTPDMNGAGQKLLIIGGGADVAVIDGDRQDRVFDLHGLTDDDDETVELQLFGITVRNGNAIEGGGLRNRGGKVQIDRSTITQNEVEAEGGGIYNENGELQISDSTISFNTTDDPLKRGGAGILHDSGSLFVDKTTFHDNVASGGLVGFGGGGGVFSERLAHAEFLNSTFSRNVATNGNGGGIHAALRPGGELILTHVTVAENQAPSGQGGGVFSGWSTSPLVQNSIFARNRASHGSDWFGFQNSTGGNLVQDVDGAISFGRAFDILNQDPLLGPLQDNGGFTLTHELLDGSPAINKGLNLDAPAVDQRYGERTNAMVSQIDDSSFAFENPSDFLPYSAWTFFAADGSLGRELYAYAPDIGVFELHTDLYEGLEGSNPTSLIVNDSRRIFFAASNGPDNRELFTFFPDNGEPRPTVVHEIHPTSSSNPEEIISHGDYVYFVANDGVHGRQIWRTRGEESTEMVTDSLPETESSHPRDLAFLFGRLYFTAIGESGRRTLFSINPGVEQEPIPIEVDPSLELGEMMVAGEPNAAESVVYLTATGIDGRPVWFEYDPMTDDGIFEVDMGSVEYSNPQELTCFGDYVYFRATHPELGTELYEYYYDASGDKLRVFDINEGEEGSNPQNLDVYPGYLYHPAMLHFSADDGDLGQELYGYDPEDQDKPRLLADIVPGAEGSSPDHFSPARGELFSFFSAAIEDGSRKIWRFAESPELRVDMGAVEHFRGSVSGVVYHDANRNEFFGRDELAIGDWTVFADLNDNGKLDPNEPNTITAFDDPSTPLLNESGSYELSGLDSGNYKIRVSIPLQQEPHFEPVSPLVPILADNSDEVFVSSFVATGASSSDEPAIEFTTFEPSSTISRGNRIFQDHASRIFFASAGEPQTVRFVVGPETRPERNDGPLGTIGEFSADGSAIAFSAREHSQIFVIDAETSDAQPISLVDQSTPMNDFETFAGFDLFVRGFDRGVIVFEARRQTGEETRQEFFAVSLERTLTLLANQYPGYWDRTSERTYGFTEIRGIDLGRGYAVEATTSLSSTGIFLGNSPYSLTVVADENTSIPWHDRKFQSFPQFSVANGRVAFRGTGEQLEGIYVGTQPLDLTRVADTSTAIPDGEGNFHGFGDLSHDADSIAFVGFGADQQPGIYLYIEGASIPQKLVDSSDAALLGNKAVRSFHLGRDAFSGGEIIFHVTYVDDSEAIFAASFDTEFAHFVSIGVGERLRNVSFGSFAATAEIQGKVFDDRSGNGRFDNREPGLGGWTVFLDQNENGQLDRNEPTVQTDANGDYRFGELTPLTSYNVALVLDPGWARSEPSGSRIDRSPYLNAGQIQPNIDFGVGESSDTAGAGGTGAIEVTLFNDLNGNGRWDVDDGESAIENQRIFVDKNNNGLRSMNEPMGFTNEQGRFTFEDLDVHSTHVVRVLHSDQFQQTTPRGNSFSQVTEDLDGVPSAIAFVRRDEGQSDLFVTQFFANKVSIVGTPTQAPQITPVTLEETRFRGPVAIVVADFDGDGRDDYAVANESGNTISIVSDALQDPTLMDVIEVGSQPRALAAGDLEGDGDIDLVVANGGSNSVTWIVNDGNRVFRTPRTITEVGQSPSGIALLHLDNDGMLDIAVSLRDERNVSLWKNNGDGYDRLSPIPMPPRGEAVAITTAQFNDDNRDGLIDEDDWSDLVVAQESGRVMILTTANGRLDFTRRNLLIGAGPTAVLVSDIDSDGDQDVISTVAAGSDGVVSILRNQGNGLFQAPEFAGQFAFLFDTVPLGMTAGDFDGDGDIDLALANGFSDGITVLENDIFTGGLRFTVVNQRTTRGFIGLQNTTPEIPGDFDGDGILGSADVNALSAAIQNASLDSRFDVNGDGAVDRDDLSTWVIDIRGTYIGDANLDGEFNSSDLVSIFTVGKFESGLDAGWAEGDWNGDGKFDSGDFVFAFGDGGFEQGPRAAIASPMQGQLVGQLGPQVKTGSRLKYR